MMRVLPLLVVLACIVSPVLAFSNGTLLPSYLCGVNDGMPKTVGGVIRLFEPEHIPDRGYPIAGYHQQKAINTTNYFDPKNDMEAILTPKPNTLLVNPTANYGLIDLNAGTTGPLTVYPGQEIALDLLARSQQGLINKDILQAPGKGNGTVAQVLGAFVYATDANGVRIGRFTAFGDLMQPWSACGPNAVGIVHTQVLNETDALANYTNPLAGGMPIYTGIKWRAPVQLTVGSKITFRGVGVTRMGFGPFTTEYTVVAAPLGAPVKPVITNIVVYGSYAAVFFVPGASNPVATYTATVTQGSTTTTNTSTDSPVIIQLDRQITTASVTITAKNTQGSTTSTASSISITPAQTQVGNVIKTLQALCPDQRFAYADDDNQCTWSTSTTTLNTVVSAFTTTTTINEASHMSISIVGMMIMTIVGVLVA